MTSFALGDAMGSSIGSSSGGRQRQPLRPRPTAPALLLCKPAQLSAGPWLPTPHLAGGRDKLFPGRLPGHCGQSKSCWINRASFFATLGLCSKGHCIFLDSTPLLIQSS